MQSSASPGLDDADDFSDSHETSNGSARAIVESPMEGEFPGCPNCGAQSYTGNTWCKRCGYYAVLGRCIELEDWERETEDGGASAAESGQPQSTSHQIPAWAWQIATVLFGVGGISVAGCYLTIADSTPRITWSLCQVFGGTAAFVLAHAFIAKAAMARNASVQLGDALLSPVSTWLEACGDIHRSSRWIVVGLAGIWAVVLAHALLGVPYGRMFTHEETPPKKETPGEQGSPKGAGQSQKQMTMEEAMNEFADKSGAKDMAGSGQLDATANTQDSEKDQPEVRALDCLIVGYKPGVEPGSSVMSVVVAIQANGGWSVVGSVSNGLTPEIQQELSAKAASLHRAQPFVACNYEAVWLEPVLRCRIEAEYQPGQADPAKLKFESLQ